MPKPNRNPLSITKPVALTGGLIELIADRIETVAPIENLDANSPVQVVIGENGGLGAKIKSNMVAYEVTVCVDGSPRTLTLYGMPESS